MKRSIFFIALGLTMAIGANARDWGFSKDTVYEWKPYGDNVLLRNQGTDTLKADTLILEIIRPTNPQPGLNCAFLYDMGVKDRGVATSSSSSGKIVSAMPIPPNKSDSLYGFFIDYVSRLSSAALPKSAAVGDTIVSRLILAALSNRGRDTLIFIGIQQVAPSGIFLWDHYKRLHTDYRVYNLNGVIQKNKNAPANKSRVFVPSAYAPEKGFLFLMNGGGP